MARRSLRRSARIESSSPEPSPTGRPIRASRRSARYSFPNYSGLDPEIEDDVFGDLEEERPRKRPTRNKTVIKDDDDEEAVPEEEEEEDHDDEEEEEEPAAEEGEDEEEEVNNTTDLQEIPEGNEDGEDGKANKSQSEETAQNRRGRGRPPGAKNKSSLVKYKNGYSETEVPRYKKKAGRKPGFRVQKKVYSPFPIPLDEDGNEIGLTEDGDEYDMPDDPKGDSKIDDLGNLLGGRDFRVRTFTVLGKGDKLYMLSTEPARCLGYRDAYYLFLKHSSLFKFILDMDEKQDLVDRKLIPNSYKSRTIGLVTARSIFKEFGSRIIIGGKKVIDDYHEDYARETGEIEGELATPEDLVPADKSLYDKKRYIAWYGGSQIYQQQQSSSLTGGPDHERGSNNNQIKSNSVKKYINFPMHKPFAIKSTNSENLISENNWLFEHGQSTYNYNEELRKKRDLYLQKKRLKKDYYTGILFYPLLTQPNSSTWYKQPKPIIKKSYETNIKIDHSNWGGLNNDIKDFNPGLIYSSVIESNSLIKKTGLKDVDLSIFNDCVDLKVKEAILNQQKLEM